MILENKNKVLICYGFPLIHWWKVCIQFNINTMTLNICVSTERFDITMDWEGANQGKKQMPSGKRVNVQTS